MTNQINRVTNYNEILRFKTVYDLGLLGKGRWLAVLGVVLP